MDGAVAVDAVDHVQQRLLGAVARQLKAHGLHAEPLGAALDAALVGEIALLRPGAHDRQRGRDALLPQRCGFRFQFFFQSGGHRRAAQQFFHRHCPPRRRRMAASEI